MKPKEIEDLLIEIKAGPDEKAEVPEGMKRIDVHVYWRWEDNKTFNIPEDMELADVQEHVIACQDEYFDFANAWLTEFEVWNIQTADGDEEWWI